jgi:hypothetical protein
VPVTRFLLNPVFSIETGELLSHEGESFLDAAPMRFDRSLAKTAGNNAKSADVTAGADSGNAMVDRSAIIPGLIQDATNPTGFTPVQKSNMLVSGGQAVGGVNSGVGGEAELAAARTRNAGGFTPALEEAARIKSRQLSNNALSVSNEDAMLAQQKQQEARKQLEGLYGTDTSNQLKAMGLSNEDLQTQLAAKKQGWLQNTLDTINTIAGVGKGAAGYKSLFSGGGGSGGSGGGNI